MTGNSKYIESQYISKINIIDFTIEKIKINILVLNIYIFL